MAYVIPARRRPSAPVGAPVAAPVADPVGAPVAAPVADPVGAPDAAPVGAQLTRRLGSTLLPSRGPHLVHLDPAGARPDVRPSVLTRVFKLDNYDFPMLATPPLPRIFPSYAKALTRFHDPNDHAEVMRTAALNSWMLGAHFPNNNVVGGYVVSSDESVDEASDEVFASEIPDVTGKTDILKGGSWEGKTIVP